MGKGTTIYLSIGSNQGNREGFLREALEMLRKVAGHLRKVSKVYESAPWGNIQQPHFLNQVVEMQTSHSPAELMKICLKIEVALGRQRIEKWGPRKIDIDILFYGDQIIEEENLSIPHPRLQERNFVLIPLNEIAPDFVHPVLKETVSSLLQNSRDELKVATVK